jgi:hypothetical protein
MLESTSSGERLTAVLNLSLLFGGVFVVFKSGMYRTPAAGLMSLSFCPWMELSGCVHPGLQQGG